MDDQAEHGYESEGRSQSAPTRPGEGGYERASYGHPDSGREQVGRPGEPHHPGGPNPEAAPDDDRVEEALRGAPVSGADGERSTEPEDVLNLDAELLVEGEEPDFQDSPGTTDVMLAVEEGLPYFPPIDPVIRPNPDDEEGIEVLGGFATDALEGPLEEEQLPPQVRRGDDELASAVARALRADSYTTDLNIEVEVVDGVVYLRGLVSSLEDIEQAEEVAGRVPGIEDVEEELEIV